MTKMRAALPGRACSRQRLAWAVRPQHNTGMNDALCRPFYAEYAWAFDLY
jgi:hypothetical protein